MPHPSFCFFKIRIPQSEIIFPLSSVVFPHALYLLQQMTAQRLDLMTPKAHDAKLDQS
jgi:hypothetical protein